MKRRIIITVGGTGGHIYPAQSLANELIEKGWEVCFVGAGLDVNKYFNREKYQYKSVCSHPISFKRPFKMMYYILKGFWQSVKILSNYKPLASVGFGSYHTIPLLLAAVLKRNHIFLYEPNSIPGRVNKVFGVVAVAVGGCFDIERFFLSGKFHKVCLPTNCYKIDKEKALEYFGLDGDCKTVLIFGGSQGAARLNELIFKVAGRFHGWQVIHLTGSEEATKKAKKTYASLGIKASVKNYEDKISNAWSAADLSITRAGAGTILEQIFFEIPAVLIPYPEAIDQHQKINAQHVVGMGGAVLIEENDDTLSTLKKELENLLISDDERAKMSDSIVAYKKNVNYNSFTALIENYLEVKHKI